MPAAGVVMIVIVVADRPGPRRTTWSRRSSQLRAITTGLDDGDRRRRRDPGEERAGQRRGRPRSTRTSTRACDLLEGLLVKKAGLERRHGAGRRPVPGAAAAGLRDFPESADDRRRRGSARSTPRARSRSPASAARPRSPRPARRGRCCATSRPRAASRARLLYPDVRHTQPGDAAALAGHRHRRPGPVRAARRHRRPAQADAVGGALTPATTHPRLPDPRGRSPGADPGAIRVRARHERRGRDRGARAASAPSARIIAGGHSLLPMMKLRLANPEHLIDINDLDELAYIREDGDEIRIGALTRHVDLLKSELLAERFPVFRDAEEVIADPVVRNRGTIGGSLCQADAAEDLSAVCSAVKASVVIRGADGERVVTMDGLPRRALHDRRRRRRDADRDPAAAAPGRRERAREGRAARRATGRSRPRRRPRLDRRRHDRRRRHRAQRGRPDDDPPRPGRGAAARPAAHRGAVRAGGRDRRRRTARPRPTAAGRSTTSATSPACSPSGHCAAPRPAPCSQEA